MERSSPGWLRVSFAGGDLRHWKWTAATLQEFPVAMESMTRYRGARRRR
jgi:hypothetical protein